MSDEYDPMKYYLTHGAVQAYVFREGDKDTDMYMCWFGMPEYDSRKPIIKYHHREKVQPIVDALNDGTMTENEATAILKTIHW
jgi:hypothetical protein